MRSGIAALTVSLLLSTAAFAQPMPPAGAAATHQPQLPSVVSEPAKNAVPPAAGASKNMPEATPPSILRTGKASGGKSDSYLIKDAPLPGDYVMGSKSAPIVMVEYASLSCPHCAHFSNTILPQLEKKYIETGKMRYILRQFPLNEPALKGAMLLDCVGQQDQAKYFTFARVLFDAQNKWAFDGNYMEGLETIATVGGLTPEQFKGCMTSTERETKILKAKKLANDELHVPHTPYIFIAGEAYEGDRSLENITTFIDAKLAQGQRH